MPELKRAGVGVGVATVLARIEQPIDILVNDAGVNRLAGLAETDQRRVQAMLDDETKPFALSRRRIGAAAKTAARTEPGTSAIRSPTIGMNTANRGIELFLNDSSTNYSI